MANNAVVMCAACAAYKNACRRSFFVVQMQVGCGGRDAPRLRAMERLAGASKSAGYFYFGIVSFFVKNTTCGGALWAISWQISGLPASFYYAATTERLHTSFKACFSEAATTERRHTPLFLKRGGERGGGKLLFPGKEVFPLPGMLY